MTQHPTTESTGIVYLIGAGPGDPGLITARGLELLRQAEVLIFDALANPVLLDEVPDDCFMIDAGKRAKEHKLKQEETNALMAEYAQAGKRVVRLKGGDPYVFGRGSEEAMYLNECGVRVEVVPGVTAAMAGIAYAGIPLTHRHVACTATFITGHEDPTKPDAQVDFEPLAELAKKGGTLCFYMGMGRLGLIVEQLTSFGLSSDTPAAVVQWGSLPYQRQVKATLADIEATAKASELGAPAIIVIGDVAGLTHEGLDWFMNRPLHGKTILITRTRTQASDLRTQLEELGATVLEAPSIRITEPDEPQRIPEAIENLSQNDWLILTSVNGVWALRDQLAEMLLDARHLHGVKVAVIGKATFDACVSELGIRPDLMPESFVAEALATELIENHSVEGKRFLLLRAEIARPLLNDKLREAGAVVDEVPIYNTIKEESLPEDVLKALREKSVDLVTFTSSSTAKNLVEMLGEERDLLNACQLASIGPITSQTMQDLGLEIAIEAKEFHIPGLIEAIVENE